MKTAKEIQLAAFTFLRAFEQNKAHELDGKFIAASPAILYQQHQYYLLGTIIFSILFIYLSYNALVVDEIYYWHIDLPVVVGILVVFLFLIIGAFLFTKYLNLHQVIKKYLENPQQTPYGVIITDEYYFENTPDAYHIIPKSNVIRIDYEEIRDNGEIYLELVLDVGEQIEIRGIIYRESEFDIKKWIAGN